MKNEQQPKPIGINRRDFLKVSALVGLSAFIALEAKYLLTLKINPYENLEGLNISECLMGNVRINLDTAVVHTAPSSGLEAHDTADLIGVRKERIQSRTSGMPNIYNRGTAFEIYTYTEMGKIVRVNNKDIANWEFLTNHDWPPQIIHSTFVIKNPAIVKSQAGTPEVITEGRWWGQPEIDYALKIPNRWVVLNTEVAVPSGYYDKTVSKIFYVYLGPQNKENFDYNEPIKFVDSDNRELNSLPNLVKIDKNLRGEYVQQNGQPIKDFGRIIAITI